MMLLLRKNTATHPLQLRQKSRRVQNILRRKMRMRTRKKRTRTRMTPGTRTKTRTRIQMKETRRPAVVQRAFTVKVIDYRFRFLLSL
jgi:hypothetical protein